MKKSLLLLIVTLVFAGCASSSRHLRRGNYDAAIERSVRKLLRNPANHDEILVLERAYRLANEENMERIRFLTREGNIRNTPEILHLYSLKKNRQTLVRRVLPLQLPDRVVNFPYVDYDEEIIMAQRGAAEYYYEQALQLFELDEKEAYRRAFNKLLMVMEYSADYKDANQLAFDARQKGISRVFVNVENKTHLKMAPDFLQRLLTVDPRGIEDEWLEFYYEDLDETIPFDYYLIINLGSVVVSPDQTSENDQVFKKTIEDGFEYVLDERGNVMKDSLGNDIRIKRYKDITATVIETQQHKSVSIDGHLELISEQPRRLLMREPLTAYTVFEHSSARALGDLNALDEETSEKIGVEPLPFPSDAEMIFLTAEPLRMAIREAMIKNKSLIR